MFSRDHINTLAVFSRRIFRKRVINGNKFHACLTDRAFHFLQGIRPLVVRLVIFPEKVSLFPLELPHHPCQNFLFRSMGLCRSASGSHPAPVPRCCGGAARRKGVRPCRVVMSVSARAPSSGQAARSAFRKVAATDTERARGRRKQHKDWPCPVASAWRWQRPGQPFGLPEHGGQQPGTANSLDKSCAMVCHKSRKFLFFAGRGR